jgi:hypothetical protein
MTDDRDGLQEIHGFFHTPFMAPQGNDGIYHIAMQAVVCLPGEAGLLQGTRSISIVHQQERNASLTFKVLSLCLYICIGGTLQRWPY